MSDKTAQPHSAPSSPAAKQPQQNPVPYIDTGAPLPEGYGQTLVVLLPRDPQWMFAYWEVTEQTARDIKQQHGEEIFYWTQAVLRMHQVSPENPRASLRHTDVNVVLDSRNWYLHADSEGSTWYVELGLKTPDGKFILIAKSNTVTLPMASVSTQVDEKWATLKDEMEKVLAASGGGKLGTGSMELTRRLSQRWSMLSQISSWKSSGAISSFGVAKVPGPKKGRMFWLVADCELIVYGATEPDAAVTIADKPIELYPDGTFSLRFALPDTKLELPIKAVSGDRVEERVIKITVERKTTTQ